MNADLEELVLSGKLFNGDSRSSSPERAPSPDARARWPHTNPDYTSPDEESDGDEDVLAELEAPPTESIGMKPGRTGVKGVIRDRAEMKEIQSERQRQAVKELNERMERTNLGGLTFLEEEALQIQSRSSNRESGHNSSRSGPGTFGHLREVGVTNFVNAIDKERSGTWVVVHIYDPSLERCASIDRELRGLAKLHPTVKFMRGRAGELGFASSSSSNVQRRTFAEELDDEESHLEQQPDLDVLPTMLVYQSGQLVHSWIRVDWVITSEVGHRTDSSGGVSDLLEKYQILPPSVSASDLDLDDLSDGSVDIEFTGYHSD